MRGYRNKRSACLKVPVACREGYCSALTRDRHPTYGCFTCRARPPGEVAARLREGKAENVAGYVIDLRNNPGNFLLDSAD